MRLLGILEVQALYVLEDKHMPLPHMVQVSRTRAILNATAVFLLQFSMIVPTISLDRDSCALVLALDDPKFCQYSGLCLLG